MSWDFAAIGTAYYYLSLVFALSLATAVVVALVFAAARAASSHPAKGQLWKAVAAEFVGIIGYALVLAFIGGLAGDLGGSSRVGVVGDLVPAVFTLLGGFVAYYFGEKRDNSGKLLANTAAFLLCFFALYNVASVWRQSNENWEFCKQIYSNPAFDASGRQDRDLRFGQFCGAVFSTWTSPGAAGNP